MCLVDLSSKEESSDSDDSELDTEIAEEEDASNGMVLFLVLSKTCSPRKYCCMSGQSSKLLRKLLKGISSKVTKLSVISTFLYQILRTFRGQLSLLLPPCCKQSGTVAKHIGKRMVYYFPHDVKVDNSKVRNAKTF